MAKEAQPYLSVVIPAYKEIDNLKLGVLETVRDYLQKQTYSWEVLIVDDGSPDKTADVIEKKIAHWKGFSLLREPHRGKGGTVIAGVLSAHGKIVLFTDMDQATPLNQIEKFFPYFEKGAALVIGSRQGRKGAPLTRKVMAYGFQMLRTIILRLPYKDTQCGFKAVTHDAAQKVFHQMKIFGSGTSVNAGVTAGFDLEMLYLARKMRLKTIEVPVEWEHKGTARVSAIRDSYQGLRDMVKVRINALSGKYKITK
ncbi:glycosyltransferase [Candidatus Woesebacteria bacterium]|nr:glycosyltransferase [Candidatus Woesebacteria bacterium]